MYCKLIFPKITQGFSSGFHRGIDTPTPKRTQSQELPAPLVGQSLVPSPRALLISVLAESCPARRSGARPSHHHSPAACPVAGSAAGAEQRGTGEQRSMQAVGGRGTEAEGASGRHGAHLLWVLLSKLATKTTSHISAGRSRGKKRSVR